MIGRRGFKERRTGRNPPPLKFSKIRVLRDIHDKCAHISVLILKSPASHKRFYFYHSDSAR